MQIGKRIYQFAAKLCNISRFSNNFYTFFLYNLAVSPMQLIYRSTFCMQISTTKTHDKWLKNVNRQETASITQYFAPFLWKSIFY